MDNQLDRIIQIVKRTGDKVVVIKDDAEFVISSLDDYARLIEGPEAVGELTESQLLDKINRDIATWRASQNELNQEQNQPDFFDQPETPSYQSLDNISAQSVQDEIDELSDDVFTGKEEEPKEDIGWDDSFDFEDDFKLNEKDDTLKPFEPVLEEEPKTQDPKNNFGYINPSDTGKNNNFRLTLSENNQNLKTDFNVPPPPDINRQNS